MRSSRGKSRKPSKKIREGTLRKSKGRPLRCKVCGRFFANLGEMNKHYSAAGHKKKKHPPKNLKFDSSKYSAEDFQQALALLEMLKNPLEFRKRIREHLEKRQRRRSYY